MDKSQKYPNWLLWVAIPLGILGLSLGLVWISLGSFDFGVWSSFLFAIILASGILLLGWWSLKSEKPPGWMGALLVGAALLRLAVGVFWFTAMPRWGHGTPAEQAGYIMADASARVIDPDIDLAEVSASRLCEIEYFVTIQHIAWHYQRLSTAAMYLAGNFVQACKATCREGKAALLSAKLPG